MTGWSVASRPKRQVMHLKSQNSLFALRFIQGTQQRKRLIRFPAQWANGLAFKLINRGLHTGVTGRERLFFTCQRDVQPEMMAPKLNHPRLLEGRCPEERNIILIPAEHR